jgi:hypothetical protein
VKRVGVWLKPGTTGGEGAQAGGQGSGPERWRTEKALDEREKRSQFGLVCPVGTPHTC